MVFLTIIGLSLFLITSLVLSYKLKQANDRLSDNALKYRYINMQGGTNQETFLKLETYFTYNRNKNSITNIRKRVETYERLIKEQAGKIERARLNKKEAEQLQKEVESEKVDSHLSCYRILVSTGKNKKNVLSLQLKFRKK